MDRYDEALAKARAEYEKAREQGYTWLMGVLEGMFPDLKESEDEKIRRHLIDIVETYWGTTNDPGKAADLAWLEKQKISTEGDFGRGYDCGYQAGYAVAKNEMKPKVATAALDSEKQKEQKPAERSLEDDHIIGFVYDLLNEIEWKDSWAMSKDECLRLLSNYSPQKPAEWSEEDDIGWDEALACVTRAEKAAKNEEELQNAVTAEKWLKEIKFKYYIHPVKPEWSDEEKDKLNSIERLIVNANAHGNYLIGDKEATDLQHFIRSIVKPTTNL